MVARVARRYLLGLLLRPKTARTKSALDMNVPLPTLWLENEQGEKHIPDFENPYDIPPKGFVYQHSRFPRSLTTNVLRLVTEEDVAACPHQEILIDHGLIESHEGRICRSCGGTQTKLKGEPWPTQWTAYGSRPAFSSSSSYPADLVLAMTRPSEQERATAAQRGHQIVPMDFERAVILAADSCERCLNVLLWRHGCDDGYEEGSPDWHKTNTSCFLCTSPEIKTAEVEPIKEPKKRSPRKKLTKDDVFRRIERSDYHFLPFDEVKPTERPLLKEMLQEGLVRLMEPKGRFPERFVITTKGSHYFRSFNARVNAESAMKYSYDRTAAKPKAQDKEPASRTDGVKKSEVIKAEKAIRAAIDAVLDCAPSSRDFHIADEDEYDSKAYNKAVAEHNKRVDALHDILEGILKLMPEAK